ncbi:MULTISPECIES: lytic transglycosylase domain-containing protein [unclassified Pseudoxanthomonas]|uniref:lytic transglycosylase domain-containing protein n=1 Tax=unclassified Pseudoxanthomonas TaxID=2645906 RepID=UPI0008E9D2C9|nr:MULTISPECIES: lytic transglycosylase domain-containing protein [unclassified Pseudoxanthomonas]PPJ41512.1 lytic transglycosylase domain-containing protein [Pseudoxanthomonas sp. KAs_5_3]SFV30087.1 type IV secretion system protein VirB1 [Pseudoxanthomonas sp. YR558]
MLPGMELMGCTGLAVPPTVMEHVVKVESSFNPYAIGVVGGRLARQPRNLAEALSTARMLEERGYNFSLGLAQVNRYNLTRQGLDSYEKAFDVCANLRAGSRILAECYTRSGNDWGKAFSCYYSGNFTTGYRHGYVQKVFASWQRQVGNGTAQAIPVIDRRTVAQASRTTLRKASDHASRADTDGRKSSRVARRVEEARSERVDAQRAAAIASDAPRRTTALPASTIVPPAISQASGDAPVTVQAYYQTTTAAPQAPQVVQTSGRDDAFVF